VDVGRLAYTRCDGKRAYLRSNGDRDMPVTYQNSPLAEIIAELKWAPTATAQPLTHVGSGGMAFGFATAINLADQNAFLVSLQTELAGCGFNISERLLPPGFAGGPHQIVYRFRNPAGSTLFQAGVGIFTANAVPPYRSWHEFEPALKQGVETLFRVRVQAERGVPLVSVSLRYINCFRERHRAGMAAPQFMREVLGIYTRTPDVLEKYRSSPHSQAESVQVQVPLQDGLVLGIVVAEGTMNNEPGLVVDFSVTTSPDRQMIETEVLAVLSRAHDIIHDMFDETTAPIRGILEPEEIAL